MRKVICLLISFFFFSLSLKSEEITTIRVGISSKIHEQIIRFIKPRLEEQKINLEVFFVPYNSLLKKALTNNNVDIVLMNKSYVISTNAKKQNIVIASNLYSEPVGLYSKKYKDINRIAPRSTVVISKEPEEIAKALQLLADISLIKIDDKKPRNQLTFKDIISNPKSLSFITSIPGDQIPISYIRDQKGDLFVIKHNKAIFSSIDPSKSALYIKTSMDSPYINVVAIKEQNINKPAIKTFIKIIESKETKDYIKIKYNNALIPVKLN